jgi:diacylglycerol kinase (ATP)
MQKVWKVIINPYAGGNTDSIVWERILLELNSAEIFFEHEVSKYHKHISEIVQKSIADGFRRFIVIGGDGSLNEMVNGIHNQTIVAPGEIITAHIPMGTGNDWHKTHKLPVDLDLIIEKIKEGKSAYQDIGVVTYQDYNETLTNYFVNVAGMGFDAMVVKHTSQKKLKMPRSRFSYLYSLFRSLMSYSSNNARISIDGKEVFNDNLFSFNVGIGKYNGGGMMQLPEAIPDDGLLDITIFREMPKIKVIANVKRLYNGSFKNLQEVTLLKGTKVMFDSDQRTMLECDGEMLGHSPAIFTIIPLGFRFIS